MGEQRKELRLGVLAHNSVYRVRAEAEEELDYAHVKLVESRMNVERAKLVLKHDALNELRPCAVLFAEERILERVLHLEKHLPGLLEVGDERAVGYTGGGADARQEHEKAGLVRVLLEAHVG